jgi:hypothetical protein
MPVVSVFKLGGACERLADDAILLMKPGVPRKKMIPSTLSEKNEEQNRAQSSKEICAPNFKRGKVKGAYCACVNYRLVYIGEVCT